MLSMPRLSCNAFHYGIFYDFRIMFLPVISYLPSFSQYVSLKFSNKDLFLWIWQCWFKRRIYFLLSLPTLYVLICYRSCLVKSQEEQLNC